MTELKTNIGKLFCKYNSIDDGFDMVRIIKECDNGKSWNYAELDHDYKVKGYKTLAKDKFKEMVKSYTPLAPDGILSLSNVVVTELENGREIKDIIMLFFMENKGIHMIDADNPCILARQSLMNIFKTSLDPNEDDVGFSITDDACPEGYNFSDLSAASRIIDSRMTNVYKFDTPSTLAVLLDNTITQDILNDLYETAIQYAKDTTLNFMNAIKDDCYNGYCNSLFKFIGHCGLMTDIYSKIGIIKTDFKLEFNKPISDENKVFLSMMCGGINIVKAVPIKFGYDIDLNAIKMKYMIVMDSDEILWIVPFTESEQEFSPLEFYKMTEEQTNRIQTRLKATMENYDNHNK